MTSCWTPIPLQYGAFQIIRPFVVDSLKVYSSARRRIERLPRVYRTGSIPVARRDEERIVELNGRIIAATEGGSRRSKAAMEELTDELKRNLKLGPLPLTLGYDDGRFFKDADLDGEVEITWSKTVPWEVLWTARFLVPEPYAYAANERVVTDESPFVLMGSGAYHKQLVLEPLGTAPAQPYYQLLVPVGAPAISSLWVENNSAFPVIQRLTITRAFASNDLITINPYLEEVKVNGSNVQYSGSYPELSRSFGDTNLINVGVIAASAPTNIPSVITWVPLYD